MRKRILYFFTLFIISTGAFATTRDAQLTNTTGYNYNYMYPYMNNQMRTNLNPGVTTSQSLSPINTVVKTTPMSSQRRVVPRKSTPRATTTPARGTITPARTSPPRRVVARSGLPTVRAVATKTNETTRADYSYTNRTASNAAANLTESESARVSSVRCMADYNECMNDYCERANTPYNRCYCSAKLSQIDSKYQPKIDQLITQMIRLKNTNTWSDDEMNEYWMDTVGKYRGENSWTNLDNALNINWADLDSRVRGQNAFTTGHEYCIQHLRGCYYMATNLRDAYRSEIARDCATYEQSLLKIQNVAESIVESYK